MKRIALCLALTTIASGAFAQGLALNEIKGSYDLLDGYVKKKDVKGIQALYKKISSKSFVSIDKDGKRKSGAEMLSAMVSILSMPGTEVKEVTSKVGKLQTKGNTLNVSVSGTYKIQILDPNKQKHTVEGMSVSLDTWKKEGATWRLAQTKTVKDVTKLDGKPMN